MNTRRAACMVGMLAAMSTAWWVGAASAQQSDWAPTSDQTARFDAIFASLDNTLSPGCAVGVLHQGRLAFARGYGMANLEHNLAITPRSIFRTGSVSKQFTAAVVVLLAQEGVFSLDDVIQRYFPELPEFDAPITIRHLLHHTSGIRDYLELQTMRGVGDESTYGEDDVVALLARQRGLNFTPGSAYLYSNSGYLLLSRLVQRTTGHTLREQAQRLIFGPLGMTHTRFQDDHRELVPERASGYGSKPDGAFFLDQTTLDIVGDGGVFTSIEDMAKWMANFWTLQIGGPEWLATMETRGVLNNGDTIDYALGLVHGVQRGLPHIGHGGAFVGYRAATLRYPSQNLAVMTLCNYARTDPSSLSLAVGEVLLADRMDPVNDAAETPAPRPVDAPPSALSHTQEESLLGTYYSEEVESTLRIYRGDQGLMVNVNGPWNLALHSVSHDVLESDYFTLAFERTNGAVTGLKARSGRAGGIAFRRVVGEGQP